MALPSLLIKRGDDGLVDVAPGCFFDPLTGERRLRLPKSKLDYGTSILTLDILGMSPASGVGPSLSLECARTTNSWKEYAEDMHKHVRCKAETTERYTGPVTANMQFGWNKVDPMRPAFGRKSCEETKIAEGQILGARRP